MTFKHKLSCRLALLKDRRLLTVVAALAASAVVNCERPLSTTDPITAVARVSISPKTVSLQPNELADFTAVSFTAAGDTSSVGVLWRATGGVVSDTGTKGGRHYGRYHNGACGSYLLIASNSPGWRSDTASIAIACQAVASVDVTPTTLALQVGQSAQLAATPKDANGSPLSGRVVTWGSSNTGVATASPSGLVTAVAPGSATITATSEGKSGTAAVTVANVPVASVAVTPASASIPTGGTIQLTATPKDANGNPLNGRAVAWTSSNGAVATVSASGLVTGVTTGSTTITATSEGQSGTSSVTVSNAPVGSVDVSPAAASLQVGQTLQLTATPKDANGAPLSGRVVTWASSNAAVATVGGSGLVTAVGLGAATITATSEGQSGASSITVTNVPVASVAVTPATASVAVGLTVQLAATPKDANGNPLTGRAVAWASSNVTVATVGASGLVTAVATGSATITATSEGQSGTAAITVTPAPVASVAVAPPSASVNEGNTVQLTATPKDANGNPLTGRTVTWASSNPTVATVSTSGLVAGKVAGAATITGTSEGQSGTATITVVHVPVASVTVSPAPASVQAGQTVQLTATPKDASGAPLTGRTVTWASNNTAVATVSGSGLVSGVAVGSATITATSEGQSGTAALTVSAPPPPGTCVTSVVALQNTAMTSQNGSFTVQYDATPNGASIDAVTGLSSGAAAAYTDLAVIARFNPTGQIDARNGGAYAAASTIPYTTGTSYHFRLVVDVPSHTYAAYVTPAGGTELTIGTGLAFRSEQSGVTALANWALAAGVGNHTVCNFAITASTPPAPVASVSVGPANPSVSVGGTVQLLATLKDANGNTLVGRVVTWASGNPAVATVSGSGLVTGVAAGAATITATSEGQSGTAAVTVIFVPVASVIVSPPAPSVQAGFTVQLTATPEDASGTPLAGRTVTWASDNTAVATVNGSGLVTGVAAGAATITATSEGKNGTAAVTVTPAPPPGSSVVLVGAGDIGNCSSQETATTTLLAGIAGTVFTAGDNAYSGGSTADYMNCYDPYWGKEKARTRPAPGNHEYNDDHSSSAPGYYNYFGPIVGDSAKYWYSYDLGAWHIVVINTWLDMSVGSPQETWLRADLAASTKRCTLAYMHYPRFSSGANHGSYSSVQPIWQALYDFGAEIAIAGHDHEYERFAPQTPSGQLDVATGIRSFVVGTGGAGLYSFSTPLPNSEVRDASTWGVIKLTLSDGSYTWQFIPIAGQTFTDAGSGTCH